MHIDQFDYQLPPELIAQHPLERRDASKLMVLNRQEQTIQHGHFSDVLQFLKPTDCLVINSSKVIPARIFGQKKGTGTPVEILLTKRIQGDLWETMVRPGKKLRPGDWIEFSNKPLLEGEIMGIGLDGTRLVRFLYDGIFSEILAEIGNMPLPPYIHRPSTKEDEIRYQTVYCQEEGSVAAPTAGLHFTPELLDKLKEKGVSIVSITLHVGIGTFRPVKCEIIEEHKMHFEEYTISESAANRINETIRNGGRVVAVGTTATRTLESAAIFREDLGKHQVIPGTSSTGIFIYPGYCYKIVDSLITNFHLPKSTLLMLVSAFYEREQILKAYQEAIDHGYRFFSYGDAMMIL
jgi:S-adenosylmethionine:tRNA ribosyltransferase-isomerase